MLPSAPIRARYSGERRGLSQLWGAQDDGVGVGAAAGAGSAAVAGADEVRVRAISAVLLYCTKAIEGKVIVMAELQAGGHLRRDE